MKTRKEQLQAMIDKAKEKIASIERREINIERKARTRCAIITGEAFIAAVKRGEFENISDATEWLRDQQLRPQDRKALGLAPLPESANPLAD